MSRKIRTTQSAVERLLEQRRLFQDWLGKLGRGTAGEELPPHVVERVRNDYRARLEEVTKELATHGDAIRQALADAQARHQALERQHLARRDELAEARLRKQVGELDEGRFKETSGRLKGAVDEVAKELAVTAREIERYQEITQLLAAKREAVKEGAPKPAPAAAPEPEREAAAPGPARPTGAVDELAFLRSVTGAPAESQPREPATPAPAASQESPAAQQRRVSALDRPAPLNEALPDVVVTPVESGPRRESGAAKRVSSAESVPERRRSEETRRAVVEGRALTCRECGAPNLPTEWYCEKCGAELSAF